MGGSAMVRASKSIIGLKKPILTDGTIFLTMALPSNPSTERAINRVEVFEKVALPSTTDDKKF